MKIVKNKLLATILVTLPFANAQNVTICSAQGNATCNETFQVCFSTDGDETCGNCINEYVEVPGKGDPNCTFISDLPWEEFNRTLQEADDVPLYLEDLTTEERLKLLYISLRFISFINSQLPPKPFKLGFNKFSADTPEERGKLFGYRYNNSDYSKYDFGRFEPGDRQLQDLPSSVNWVEEKAVTEVKDQGRCGCCWALSVVGAAEGAAALTPENEGFLENLSFQQLISCDDDNYGCGGGNIVLATGYSWKNDFGGLASLNEYPYADYKGDTTKLCGLKDEQVTVELNDCVVVMSYGDSLSFDERVQTMKAALARQPVSMALRSNCNTLASYSSGVMTEDGDCACEDTSCIDHAVLLVGYNDDSNPPYWLVKNSWGTGWGESGYFRISQEGGGQWGLFGMLGEGVVCHEAFTTTSEKPDTPTGKPDPDTPTQQPDSSDQSGFDRIATWWQIPVVVLTALVVM